MGLPIICPEPWFTWGCGVLLPAASKVCSSHEISTTKALMKPRLTDSTCFSPFSVLLNLILPQRVFELNKCNPWAQTPFWSTMLSCASWLTLTPDPAGCQEGVCELARKMGVQHPQNNPPNGLKPLCALCRCRWLNPYIIPKFQTPS